MKKVILFIGAYLLTSGFIFAQEDSVITKMNSFIKDDGPNAGLLFGCSDKGKIKIWTVGSIDKQDELRVACPTSKPIICYLILKSGIDINTPISKWFPKKDGFTSSDSITVKMLMLNTSGIMDYVRLIPNHPDSIITIEKTISLAYKNKNLLFKPGTSWEYSNTNFNLLGLILENEYKKSFEKIVIENFHSIAPSLRMDNGKGKYPKGYMNPWPYHWSAPGYAGGLICTAEDAIKVLGYISKQKEFSIMSKSYDVDGSYASFDRWGLGVYLNSDFNGLGKTIYYDGNMGACKMDFYLINNKVYYFYAPYPCPKGLNEIEAKLMRE
jgi:hypothetical protein